MGMAECEKNWLFACAKAFGMTVKEFAECIGYSRQALYQANEGIVRLDGIRLSVSQYKLDAISQKMFDDEIAKAKKSFYERNKLIDELMERLCN